MTKTTTILTAAALTLAGFASAQAADERDRLNPLEQQTDQAETRADRIADPRREPATPAASADAAASGAGFWDRYWTTKSQDGQ